MASKVKSLGFSEKELKRYNLVAQFTSLGVSLVTDRKDLSADLIALIYRYRWQVELTL